MILAYVAKIGKRKGGEGGGRSGNIPATGIRLAALLGRDPLVVARVRRQVAVVPHLGAGEPVLHPRVDAGLVAARAPVRARLGLVAVEVALGFRGDVAHVLG